MMPGQARSIQPSARRLAGVSPVRGYALGFLAVLCVAGRPARPEPQPASTRPASREEPAVRAVDFKSTKVYQSSQSPSYTSWVSFFPGERGQWYLTCEEVTRPATPLPASTPQQYYEMGLPAGYDKAPYQMEIVMLESRDDLATWKVISRQPGRFQHSAGSFGQARTRDGRFLRFLWSCYSLDPSIQANEIFYESDDDGTTWKKMPPFHDSHFVSHPHRLRTLRDGTLVLAVPLSPRWGKDSQRPVRSALSLNVINQMQMTLFFSHDQGRTWDGPLPVYGGQNVSETDFVELPDGHLLLIHNSIFANPGRQFVYRNGNRFTPGPLERVRSGRVPETVCLTREGLLIGCMRAGSYSWSDDLGENWSPLAGIPRLGPEVYQPWINLLPDGRIACAGHYGYDDAIGTREQYVSIHTFRVEQLRKTQSTRIRLERDFDDERQRWKNSFMLQLTSGDEPLANKELEFWYVERGRPGADSWNKTPLEERMKAGGTSIRVHTGADGTARVDLPHLDPITDTHYWYQVVVRFNADGKDTAYRPAQTPQFNFYANNFMQTRPE